MNLESLMTFLCHPFSSKIALVKYCFIEKNHLLLKCIFDLSKCLQLSIAKYEYSLFCQTVKL
uniref:Uncharacterized protein n=1 Tax=Anguilla anguilla TaxID=7936 RepID=A0A0E9RNQ0_ANGAN